MDSDIKRWEKILDIEIKEEKLVNIQDQIDELYRKRNETRITLNLLRNQVKEME